MATLVRSTSPVLDVWLLLYDWAFVDFVERSTSKDACCGTTGPSSTLSRGRRLRAPSQAKTGSSSTFTKGRLPCSPSRPFISTYLWVLGSVWVFVGFSLLSVTEFGFLAAAKHIVSFAYPRKVLQRYYRRQLNF